MTWKTIAIRDSLRRTAVGRNNQVLSSDIKGSGQYPVVDQGQAYIAGYSDEDGRVIRDDLPLVVFGDHTRAIKFVDFPFILGADGTKVLKPQEELFDARFFAFALKNLNLPSRGYNRHYTILREQTIPLPDIAEQKRIASILNFVEQAIEQQERLIAITRELKSAVLKKIFSEGLRGEAQKNSEIGQIPQNWTLVEIGSLGTVITGSTPKTSVAEYYSPPEIDFIAPADLGKTRDVYDSEKKISQIGLKAIRPLPINSVMCVCIGSSVGKVGMTVRTESATNQQINSVVCNDSHDPHFIYYLLSHFSSYWRSFATFGPVPILNKGNFETIKVIVPPTKAEEVEISEVLRLLDAKVETHMRKRELLNELFHSLLRQLMTEQIRVHDFGPLEFERSAAA